MIYHNSAIVRLNEAEIAAIAKCISLPKIGNIKLRDRLRDKMQRAAFSASYNQSRAMAKR